jgi:pimeloyl-ACP methyl ester carboxylesterase
MRVNDRVPYDEFSMLADNAREAGLPCDQLPAVRRERVDLSDGRWLSGLVWGEGSPELVFLHGGAQNAHTWDTVLLALGRPALALDLPSHGHSGPPRVHATDTRSNVLDVATVLRQLAPEAQGVVGMSLGGMTTLALIEHAPDVARRTVLVDVTPGVDDTKSTLISDFIRGPASFASFDEILARTMTFNPTRSESSLRRGILHNAEQQDDGSWVWRYRRFGDFEANAGHPDFRSLWPVVNQLSQPALLVRGMRSESVVDDADEAEWLSCSSRAWVVRVAEAGHSLQGDTPLEFARILQDFYGEDRVPPGPTS